MLEQIRAELSAQTDQKYKEFNDKLIPGTGETLGVRVPRVRELARRIAVCGGDRFLREMEAAEDRAFYQEERMLQGMVIGYGDFPPEERERHLDGWVPKIESWAVCDCGVSTLKFMEKDRERWFPYVCRYLESSREYELRFAAVALMDHFMDSAHIRQMLSIYRDISHEGYYVKMAVAWAVSMCYVNYPRETEALLKSGELPVWTHNKAIQKIRESRRVSPEDKERLAALRRQIVEKT